MKALLEEKIDSLKDEIADFGRDLFEHPQLGFKEFYAKEKIIEILKKHHIEVEEEYFETGFQVTLGKGEGPWIGLAAELDAIPTLGHPYEKEEHAAHSCGHSTQVAIAVNVLCALADCGFFDHFCGKVTCFFTPAEEFTDLDYRKNLICQKKIKYLSGKENMLAKGCFDQLDCLIHMHGMGEYRGEKYSVRSSLAGFIYKKFNFIGKSAHAAVAPDEGINALNEFALFQSAVAMLRETFKEEDLNRIHGIVTHGGETVNSIPSSVIYEAYVRSFSQKRLNELSEQLNKTAKCCAAALNGDCIIEDIPGYFPLVPNRALSDVAEKNMLRFTSEDQIEHDGKSIAAGDIGDVSCFIPTIQFGYTGFKGVMHGKDLEIADPETVYQETAKIIAGMLVDLFENPALIEKIKQEFTPALSKEQYLNYLDARY